MFKDNAQLQMGLFLTVLKPTGPFSTAWTLILNGNVDLSITMCVMNILLSCGELVFISIFKKISKKIKINHFDLKCTNIFS